MICNFRTNEEKKQILQMTMRVKFDAVYKHTVLCNLLNKIFGVSEKAGKEEI